MPMNKSDSRPFFVMSAPPDVGDVAVRLFTSTATVVVLPPTGVPFGPYFVGSLPEDVQQQLCLEGLARRLCEAGHEAPQAYRRLRDGDTTDWRTTPVTCQT